MTELLITSSVLITALLVLRNVFRNILSRRVQYALWGLVLLRLLIPVSLPAVDFSVLTAVQPVERTVTQTIAARPVYIPVARAPLAEHPTAPDLAPEYTEIAEGESVWVVQTENTAVQYKRLPVYKVLSCLWLVGSGAAMAFLLAVNGHFWLNLRRNRKVFPVEGCALPVYLVETGLSSPCLFGLFRPAIYLTPAALASPERLAHVLAHEETHARHLDHLWTLLRGVCLAVYWFDPLVWMASSAAKTDCELACDEGTLARLGEAARIPYGQTLLSLIPVKRSGNPMLAATTMAAGKKQLKDRFTRIAQRPKQLAAAALAAALLAGLVSACTFTGGKIPDVSLPNSSSGTSQEDAGLRALTGEELQFFNEQFFNGGGLPDESGYGVYSIRNQFASPWFSYGTPEDIDLGELFYCEGTTEFSDEELRAVLGYSSRENLPCPAYKLTTDEINRILTQYTGLTLEQTNKTGLDLFLYSADYDAYYFEHGDTNYCGNLSFAQGTREGNTVRLYHGEHSGGWTCVTLEEQENGEWWFQSNQACEKPNIPTPMPAGEPETVISLDGLEPYEAPAVTLETRVNDFEDTYENRLANWSIDGRNVVIYRARDGVIRAGIWDRERSTVDVFLTDLDENASVFFYRDLFGHSGFTVSYDKWENWEDRKSFSNDADLNYGTFVDYYYFTENGSLALLLRTLPSWGQFSKLDLDGNGADELLSPISLILQRDGQLFRADLYQLIQEACAPLNFWGYSELDSYSRRLRVEGYDGRNDGWQTVVRWLYFDGENNQLLLYEDTEPAAAT